MAGETTLASITGYTKDIWSKLIDLFPPATKLLQMASFDTGEQVGGLYKQNVIVQEEAGFAHAATGAGAFTTGTPSSLVTKDVYLQPFQITLDGSIDYESASRASSSKKAYADIVGKKLVNMMNSMRKRLEIEAWYGQEGLGVVDHSSNVDTTHTVLTIAAAEHAPLLWNGKIGHKLMAYAVADNAYVDSGNALTITSVNVLDGTRTVTVSGATGTISALDTLCSSTPGTNACKLYFAGTRSGTTGSVVENSMIGIMKAGKLSSGTIWNIDVGTYDLFRPSQYSVGGALTLTHILNGLAVAANRGLAEDVDVIVHPRAFANMAADSALLRRYGGSEVSLKNGAKGLQVQSQDAIATIQGYGLMKAGYAFAAPKRVLKRIGSQDISFRRPGQVEGTYENIFWDMQTAAGYGFRLYTGQSIFCEELARVTVYTGITNN